MNLNPRSRPHLTPRRIATALVLAISCSIPLVRAQPADEPWIAFIGLHGGVFDHLQGFAKELGLRVNYVDDEEIAGKKVDLSLYRLIFIQHTREEDKDAYRSLFLDAKKGKPPARIFALGREGASAVAFFKDQGTANPVETDAELSKYFPRSRENLRRFLIYVSVKYLKKPGTILPPVEADDTTGPYHPDHDGHFASVDDFLKWSAAKGRDPAKLARAAVMVHNAHLAFQQPKVVDALIRAFEAKGILAAAFTDGGPQGSKQLPGFKPDVVIHTCHSGETVAYREKVGAPHLHSLFFRRYSIDHWREHLEGFTPGDAAFQVIGQEHLGAIEPLIGAGTLHGSGGAEAFTPIPDRIDHIVDRAASWVALRKTSTASKKIAFIYYDREAGQNELMRGSTTGMHLHAPKSMVKVLKRMKADGYDVSTVPDDEGQLIKWILDRGRQYGLWNQGELDRLAASGKAVLIPEATYVEWFNKRVPEAVRADVVKRWGPAPGNAMIWNNQGKKSIVIPRIDLGNVILLPQPLRGEVQDPTLLHSGLTPPPHNYIATYFWLQEGFHANALVHFGTHGSEFFLPAKPVGLSERDWPDILMGSMPNINPWIIDNVGESAPVKRRAYGITLGHLTPPITTAGLSDDLLNLHSLIDKWDALEESALRETFRRQISTDVARLNLTKEAGLGDKPKELLSPDEIRKIVEYLHDIEGETTPVSLHVLGEPPRDDLMVPFLTTILKRKFLDALGTVVDVPTAESRLPGDRVLYLRQQAEEAVAMVVRRGLSPGEAIAGIGGKIKPGEPLPAELQKGLELVADLFKRFQQTRLEIDNLMAAFDGKYIPPGPINSPIRNPSVVPTGRNLYMLNPEEVPTRPSWEMGKKLVDQLLERSLKQKGRYPAKIAMDLRPHATFRDYGVMEAQIFYLLGVEPVWDDRDLVNDVKIIPADQLKRPRIDVFVAPGGLYALNLPGRLELIDKAIRMVAELDEKENTIRTNSERVRGELIQRGIKPELAKALSVARIFGVQPGEYGSPGNGTLIQRSGHWTTRDEVVAHYLAAARNVFTKGHWGEPAPEAYDRQMQGTDTVLRGWSDHMTSPLANKYMWLHGGSLAMAIKQVTGKEPEYLLSDVRDFDKSGIVKAEDALAKEFRVRLFNRKWIEGMMKEGYAGADHVAAMVDNAMGWQVVREGSIAQETWAEIEAIYVQDKLGLSVRKWFDTENPFAFQELSATMLEAIRKGYWKASAETTQRIAENYARSVIRHGDNGGLRSGGNGSLQQYVEQSLFNSGVAALASLKDQYHAKIQEATAATAAQATALAALGPAPAPATETAPPSAATPAPVASGPVPAAASTAAPPSNPAPVAEAKAEVPAKVELVPIQGQRLAPAPSPEAKPAPLEATDDRTWFGGWLLAGSILAIVLGGFFWRRNVA